MNMAKIFVVMTMALGSALLAAESAKLALVVGNATYTDGIPELRNPVNDASDISAVLEKEGWRVTRLLNASRRDLNKALVNFKDSMKGNPGSTSLFYYAGHGVQIDGKNYMLPIGEIFEGKDDIVLSAFCIDLVVDAFSEGKAKDSLIILDACREDPFAKAKTRAIGTTRGLAVVPLPETEGGSATILATKAGDVAQDGSGRNGLFTEAFLKNFDAGLSLDQFFVKVKADVVAMTGGKQTPQIQTSGIMTGFYLGKRRDGSSAATSPSAPAPVAVSAVAPRRSGTVLVSPAEQAQAGALLVTALRQDTGAITELLSNGPTDLAAGVYEVSAMFKDDSEPAYKRTVSVESGVSTKLSIPSISYSVAYQKKTLVAEKNSLLPSFTKADAAGSTQRMFGWLSVGIGLAGAGFAAFEYMVGTSAYSEYLAATSTSQADELRARAAMSSTLFSVSAAAGGLVLAVSPLMLFADPAKAMREKIKEIDAKLGALGQESGHK